VIKVHVKKKTYEPVTMSVYLLELLIKDLKAGTKTEDIIAVLEYYVEKGKGDENHGEGK
jgi:hypothetical protein